MTQEVREQKVIELNRLLPMVRQMLSLKIKENEVSEKLKKAKKERETGQRLIHELEKLYKCFVEEEKESQIISHMTTIIDTIAERIEENSKLIEGYLMEMKQYRESYGFQKKLCRAIISVLPAENGFLYKQEIKEMYIKEYVYLMCLSGLGLERLTKENVFAEPEAEKEFFNRVDKILNNGELSTNITEMRLALEKGIANEDMFFKCFF